MLHVAFRPVSHLYTPHTTFCHRAATLYYAPCKFTMFPFLLCSCTARFRITFKLPSPPIHFHFHLKPVHQPGSQCSFTPSPLFSSPAIASNAASLTPSKPTAAQTLFAKCVTRLDRPYPSEIFNASMAESLSFMEIIAGPETHQKILSILGQPELDPNFSSKKAEWLKKQGEIAQTIVDTKIRNLQTDSPSPRYRHLQKVHVQSHSPEYNDFYI